MLCDASVQTFWICDVSWPNAAPHAGHLGLCPRIGRVAIDSYLRNTYGSCGIARNAGEHRSYTLALLIQEAMNSFLD